MGKAITADEHNATRRAVKAKQRANRKAAAKGNRSVGGPPISIAEAERDRLRHQRKVEKRKANEDRLISIVLTRGILVLNRPNRDNYDGSTDCRMESEGYSYEFNFSIFERNVADVKRAAKARKAHFHWHDLPNGDFAIALPSRA